MCVYIVKLLLSTALISSNVDTNAREPSFEVNMEEENKTKELTNPIKLGPSQT